MPERGEKARNRSAANSGRVPFAPAYVPELYDSRLSSDEKILLWKIRYRAGVKGATWISWETMAEESDKSRRSIMRQIKKLQELGFLTTESRGFGKTTDKVIECPTMIYPSELCDTHTVSRYFRKDRSEEDLSELMSKSTSSAISDTTDDDRDSQVPHECHQCHPISATSGTSLVPPVALKLDNRELDKEELDPLNFVQREPQQAGTPGVVDEQSSSPGGSTPLAENLGSSAGGKGDSRRARARELQDAAGRGALSKAKAAKERREARKAEREASGLAEKLRRYKELTKADRQTIASKLEDFCRPTAMNWFPGTRAAPPWGPKEYTQANKLLEKYEGDIGLVEDAWEYLCREWDTVKKKLKLMEAYPTIGLLLGCHDRVFPLVQESLTTKEDVESRQLDSEVGWG